MQLRPTVPLSKVCWMVRGGDYLRRNLIACQSWQKAVAQQEYRVLDVLWQAMSLGFSICELQEESHLQKLVVGFV